MSFAHKWLSRKYAIPLKDLSKYNEQVLDEADKRSEAFALEYAACSSSPLVSGFFLDTLSALTASR